MVGKETSGNPYSIPINYDREIGEPIILIIRKKGYGKGTYAGMVLMQNLKDEIFAYWKEKGEDPQALWDKWFKKWSMKEFEQKEADNQKAKETHNQTVNQYVALGESRENAENLASLFPDSNPLDILKGKNYNTQNKPIENTIESKKDRELEKNKEELGLLQIKNRNDEHMLEMLGKHLQEHPEQKENIELKMAQIREDIHLRNTRIAELTQNKPNP